MPDVVDVERYIEGFLYGTVSIVHPLTCCLRATFQSGTIFSLDVDEPQGDRIQMLESDLRRADVLARTGQDGRTSSAVSGCGVFSSFN